MKKVLTFTIAAIIAMSTLAFTQVHAQTAPTPTSPVGEGPKIVFADQVHDFGDITEGTQAKYSFKFTNTGNQPLVVTNVSTPCGCTTPSYTHDPVAPGKTGEIAVNYNSTGRGGQFTKVLTVTTNMTTNNTTTITIKGSVSPKPAAPAPAAAQPSKQN